MLTAFIFMFHTFATKLNVIIVLKRKRESNIKSGYSLF